MESTNNQIKSSLTNLYFGKTPNISENIPSHVIGILDCSGSMNSHFNMLVEAWNDLVKSLRQEDITTVLFSSEAKLKKGNLIERDDCNGSTNILSGFALAFEEIRIDDEAQRMAFYEKCGPSVRQMPQIFINDQRVGGLAGLQAALTQLGR